MSESLLFNVNLYVNSIINFIIRINYTLPFVVLKVHTQNYSCIKILYCIISHTRETYCDTFYTSTSEVSLQWFYYLRKFIQCFCTSTSQYIYNILYHFLSSFLLPRTSLFLGTHKGSGLLSEVNTTYLKDLHPLPFLFPYSILQSLPTIPK